MDANVTIAGLADKAGVGVETVRYYERRGLIPRPERNGSTYRRYGQSHVARIRFIRHAQELGFSLEEVRSLLELDDGTDRKAIRRIASARLEDIRHRISALRRMERALSHHLHECESNTKALRCPIIAAIDPVHCSMKVIVREVATQVHRQPRGRA